MVSATDRTDYYEVLGVSKDATQDEIRKVYRDLARKYHPDKTGGDAAAEKKLKEINAAYDVLKRPEKRKEYDRQRSFEGMNGFNFSDAAGSGANFSEIFSSLFGGAGEARTATAAQAGNDLEARVHITLKEVVSGTQKMLRINRPEVCPDCDGSGAAPGTSTVTCEDCGGSGQLARGGGFFQMTQTCPRCRGTGQTVSNPCAKCSGSGRARAQREINVTIPPGVVDGNRLRIPGEGEAGYYGGPRGDLYVRIAIDRDPFFVREGDNLVCDVPITFVQAALGAKVSVPTLDGVASLTIAPGTQNGTLLRMRGMGLPRMGGGPRGDEFVKVIVEVPKKLTRDQVKLLRQFDGNYEPDSHPIRDRFNKLMERLRGVS